MKSNSESKQTRGAKAIRRVPGQKLNAYLNDMCQKLAALSHRPNLPYQLEIVDASVVNAFAVPGGYVYLTRGILANLNSEAELAGVMAMNSGTSRPSFGSAVQPGTARAGRSARRRIVSGDVVSGLAQLGAGMLFLSFSRDNERQAISWGWNTRARQAMTAKNWPRFLKPGAHEPGLGPKRLAGVVFHSPQP